jgi:hypothetical protein
MANVDFDKTHLYGEGALRTVDDLKRVRERERESGGLMREKEGEECARVTYQSGTAGLIDRCDMIDALRCQTSRRTSGWG